MNERYIAWQLATRHPFHARRHLALIPNLSWGFLDWEADLIVLTKSRRLWEIEIKCTMQDWRADFLKPKHKRIIAGSVINRFYYAAPKKLMDRHAELPVPEGYGLISVADEQVSVVREAKRLNARGKISEIDTYKLLRLAAIKAWGLEHRKDLIEEKADA